jgi:hypothetical protein
VTKIREPIVWIPYAKKPSWSLGSTNPPDAGVSAHWPLNTSIAPPLKFAA